MRLTSRKGDEGACLDRLRASLGQYPQLQTVIAGFHDVLNEVSSSPLIVGVSGGGDSVALLLLLRLWGRRELIVAHVDHGLQSQSKAWAQGVEAICAEVGVRFIGLTWADPVSGPGVSHAARLARHRLLANAAREVEASVICLGHNLDDAHEAAWMRTQGSNTGTAKPFAPSPVWPEGRDIFLYRPLIGIGRQVLRDWLRASGVDYLDDPANADPKYLRSRARLALEGQGESLSGEGSAKVPVIDTATYQALRFRSESFEPFGIIALKTDVLKALKPERAQKILAAGMVAAGGGEVLPASGRVKALLETLEAPITDDQVQKRTLCGALFLRTPEVIYLGRDMGDARLKRRDSGLEALRLNAGQVAVWDGRFDIRALKDLDISANLGHGLMRTKTLAPDVRAKLMALPADLRRGLPVAVISGAQVSTTKCDLGPIPLWENYNLPIYNRPVRVRALVAARFKAALGLVVQEPSQLPDELMD